MHQPPSCVCGPWAPVRSLSYSCLRSCQDDVVLGQLRSEPSLYRWGVVIAHQRYSQSDAVPLVVTELVIDTGGMLAR